MTACEEKSLAPIALFAFNRPEHLTAALDALARNNGAKDSQLYIFVDGARDSVEEQCVERTINIAAHARGFQKVGVKRRSCNYGLRRNIELGVSEVVEKHGKVIVFEDDIISSPACLEYLNEALDRYHGQSEVWHISAWAPACGFAPKNVAYFSPVMHCWGWATWYDKWRRYERSPARLRSTWSETMVREFNLGDRQNFWSQVIDNDEGLADTWAIFWYATIFEAGGLCLNPAIPLVRNVGFDGSGVNCGRRFRRLWSHRISDRVPTFPSECVVDAKRLKSVRTILKAREIARRLVVGYNALG